MYETSAFWRQLLAARLNLPREPGYVCPSDRSVYPSDRSDRYGRAKGCNTLTTFTPTWSVA